MKHDGTECGRSTYVMRFDEEMAFFFEWFEEEGMLEWFAEYESVVLAVCV